jgi:predicted alpha/beta-fold hydrolase
MNLGFRAMLVSRLRSGRFPASQIRTIPDFMEKVAAPSYGVTPEELWRRTSAVNNIGAAAVPVLVLHPVDDGIVPVEHARMLDKAAAGNDWVRVWMLPGGAHGATDAIDRDWTFAVYRAFFERWAEYPARPEAEMVYSGQDGGKVKVDG